MNYLYMYINIKLIPLNKFYSCGMLNIPAYINKMVSSHS